MKKSPAFLKPFKRWWNITKTQFGRALGRIVIYSIIVVVVVVTIYSIFLKNDSLKNYLNVSYITSNKTPITVITTNTTIFTTLMTVILALVALAVTAYVFLNDSLSNREEYEQGIVFSLKSNMRKRLFIFCALSGLCIIACMIIDNAALCGWSKLTAARYGVVFASTIAIVFLIIFINSVVNYEKHLIDYGRSYVSFNQKRLVAKLENDNNNEVKDEGKNIIKEIGDIENLINCIQSNHESEYGLNKDVRDPYMLKSILMKKRDVNEKIFKPDKSLSDDAVISIYEDYRRLIEIRNCLLVLQRSMEDETINRRLFDVVKNMQSQLMSFAYHNERFFNLNFNDVEFKKGIFAYSSLRQSALVNIDFSKAILNNCDFSESLLQDVNFEGAECKGTVFSGARIIHPIIDKSTVFENAVFRNSELIVESVEDQTEKTSERGTGTSFNNSLKDAVTNQDRYNFKNISCQHANFVHSRFVDVEFTNSSFSNASLADAILYNCNFSFADFTGAILSTAKIDRKCCFEYANCSDIVGVYSDWGNSDAAEEDELNLSNSRFSHANLANAKMAFCTFTGSYMNDATFISAHLSNCNFDRTLLTNADFSYAKIDNCRFTGALLSGSLLIGNGETSTDYKKDMICDEMENMWTIQNTKYDKVEMVNCNIRNQVFENCSFEEVAFDSSVIRDTVFRGCSFSNSQFNDVLLFNVIWENCTGIIEKSATTGMRFGTSIDKKRWKKSFLRSLTK